MIERVEIIQPNLCLTWTLEEVPVAAAGVHIPWDGLGHCWALMTPDSFAYGRTITAHLLRSLDHIAKENQIHRFEMEVQVGHAQAERWAEFLGFHVEGKMVRYGPAPEMKDYTRYARIL